MHAHTEHKHLHNHKQRRHLHICNIYMEALYTYSQNCTQNPKSGSKHKNTYFVKMFIQNSLNSSHLVTITLSYIHSFNNIATIVSCLLSNGCVNSLSRHCSMQTSCRSACGVVKGSLRSRWESVRYELWDRSTQMWALKMTQAHNQHWYQSFFYSRLDLSCKSTDKSGWGLDLRVHVCVVYVLWLVYVYRECRCLKSNCFPPRGFEEKGSLSLPFTLQLSLTQCLPFLSLLSCLTLPERSLCHWGTGFVSLFFW